MVDRWRGILGRVNDGVAPRQGYREFVSYFDVPVSEFPLTYGRDKLIDEVSISVCRGKGRRDWLNSLTSATAPLFFIWRTIPLYYTAFDMTITRCDAPPTRTLQHALLGLNS